MLFRSIRHRSLVVAPFYLPLLLGRRPGHDAGVEELVPGVGQARQAPVDAVGVRLGVRLLLRREQLPLPERVQAECKRCLKVVVKLFLMIKNGPGFMVSQMYSLFNKVVDNGTLELTYEIATKPR